MNSVKDHYDKHLGDFYAWMVGDFESKQQEQEAFFRSKNLFGKHEEIAIDLGAGHGLQSLSLARLGYQVIAVDFNQQLINELALKSQDLSIDIVNSDLLTYMDDAPQVDLIVCMGDTLAHMPSFEALEKLFNKVYEKLLPGGKWICSFRDYQVELVGTQRFIPVKSDEHRILTCFLEYEQEKVRVTDLLHEKSGQNWQQKVSSYDKLRLGLEQVKTMLQAAGFEVYASQEIKRMNYLCAQKPLA